jgi:hypothetical protein
MSELVTDEYTALAPVQTYKIRLWDIGGKDMAFFLGKLKTCFELEWFKNKDAAKIRDQFAKILVGPQKNYCVVLGVAPSYMIQAKKQSVLNIVVEGIAIFIFLPKQIDIPVLKKINLFSGDTGLSEK